MSDSEEEPEGAPGAEEDARTGLIDAYSDDDDERDDAHEHERPEHGGRRRYRPTRADL